MAVVPLLKGKQGDILRLPGVVYPDCRTNLTLQERDLYNHVRIEVHLYIMLGQRSVHHVKHSVDVAQHQSK